MERSSIKPVNFGDSGMYVASPRNFIVPNPTSRSVRIGCEYVNLSAIARSLGFDQTHLSRIMAGERKPSPFLARKISEALGIEIVDLFDGLKVRKQLLERKRLAERKNRLASIRRNEKWLQSRGLLD